MNTKHDCILKLARDQFKNGKTITGADVAAHLNGKGLTTNYGTRYKGGRGTYRLIKLTYHWLYKQGMFPDAEAVAKAFTKPNGTYAYL